MARVVAMAAAGVEPRIMGVGPEPAARKVLERAGLAIGHMDVIELNEAFAAQALGGDCASSACRTMRAHVNPNGGAIAMGHPLGMSGARLAGTAAWQLQARRRALCAVHDVRGRGAGNRHDARARLTR